MKSNTLPILLATTFLSTSAMAITLEPTLEDSVISYSEGTASNYNFTVQEADANGNLTTKYYKIDIDEDKLSTSSNISWTALDSKPDDMTNVVEVKLPNNQEKYFKYAYTTPSGYETITESENISVVNPTDNNTIKYVGVAINNASGTNYGNIDKKMFLNNEVTANLENNINNRRDLYAYGGAILNQGEIGDIVADFIGNSIETTVSGSYSNRSYTHAYGGAIFNSNGVIGDITGDFIDNYVSSTGCAWSSGGAIFNSNGIIGDITGDFIGNYAKSTSKSTSTSDSGGAIYNEASGGGSATIGNITGNFIGNYAGYLSYTEGGAIYNGASGGGTATIGNITGNFIGNYASGSSSVRGGAIFNFSGTIGDITGDFVGNYAESKIEACGGAIYNYSAAIDSITGDFIGNYVSSIGSYSVQGGAIYNIHSATIDGITSDFIGNYASGSYSVQGGAIYNIHSATIGSITGDFIGNYAKSTLRIAQGGAIYTTQSMSLTSGSDTHFFDGNYTEDKRGKIYNAIYVDDSDTVLTFNTSNDGAWVINDNIENGNYNVIGDDTIDTEFGTTTQYINMNNSIINAWEVKVENTTLRFGAYQHKDKTAKNWDTKGKFIASLNEDGTENIDADSVTSLTLNNAVFDISNGYLETVKLKKYSATDSFVHLDVDVENMTSDVLNVKGDVDGVTKLVIHATSDKDIRGQGQILFAVSFGDTLGNEKSFEVARVYKSPYLYDVIYEGVANTTTTTASKDNKWSLEMNGDENKVDEDSPVDPNPDVPTPDTPDNPVQPLGPIQVAPEIIGFEALQSAGLAQTNGMIYNIMRKVGINKLYCKGCGFYDYNWNGEAFHNVWVDTTYNGLTIEAPVEIEAKVWGIEAGSDLQHDLNNKLGIFVSYRQGNYEMDGKGEKYYSNIGSEIDIDSYLAGLYYRYDYNDWYAFATVYGGMQNAKIKTDDGVSADTDGIEFGGSIEAGYNYALTRKLSVTPSLGAFYSQISYDDATDNVGKTVNYNDLKQVELEAGAKFAYTQYTDDGFYSLYVKPSVVQTLIDGDEINITEIGKVDTVEDKTLGRVELGGNIGFNENWSAYGWANYTFGSSYDATSLGLGVNYAW